MEVAACQTCLTLRRFATRYVAKTISNSKTNTSGRNGNISNINIQRQLSMLQQRMIHRDIFSQNRISIGRLPLFRLADHLLQKDSYTFFQPLSWCQLRYMRTISSDDSKDWARNTREIELVLNRHHIPFVDGYTCLRSWCISCKGRPAAGTTRRDKPIPISELGNFIDKTSGSSICKDCGTKETWKNLQVCN